MGSVDSGRRGPTASSSSCGRRSGGGLVRRADHRRRQRRHGRGARAKDAGPPSRASPTPTSVRPDTARTSSRVRRRACWRSAARIDRAVLALEGNLTRSKSRSCLNAACLLLVWILCGVSCRCGSRGGREQGRRRSSSWPFVTNNSADFWTIARRGVEKADAELADVEAEFRLTAGRHRRRTAADRRRPAHQRRGRRSPSLRSIPRTRPR